MLSAAPDLSAAVRTPGPGGNDRLLLRDTINHDRQEAPDHQAERQRD